jgi:hypothetical protein
MAHAIWNSTTRKFVHLKNVFVQKLWDIATGSDYT